MSSEYVDLKHLSATHQAQVDAYLGYFRAKRYGVGEEVAAAFDECREVRLLEDMYTEEDVVEILEGLKAIVKQNVMEDHENYTHQAVLFLRELYLQCEGHDVHVRIDTSILDDERLLSAIKRMDQGASARVRPDDKGRQVSGLVDSKLVMRIKELETRNDDQGRRLSAAESERDDLRLQLERARENGERLERQLAASQRDLGNARASDLDASLAELAALRASAAEAEEAAGRWRRQAEETERELQGKVSATKQFTQLKRLIAQKNQQLKAARQKLRSALSPDDYDLFIRNSSN